MNGRTLEDIVRDLLEERFPGTEIIRVVVSADRDSDGDQILRITVVTAAEPRSLDRSQVLGFAGLLKPRLEEAHSDGFPIMSFVSARDAGKLRLEAA